MWLSSKRPKYLEELKAKVALKALWGDQTLQGIASMY